MAKSRPLGASAEPNDDDEMKAYILGAGASLSIRSERSPARLKPSSNVANKSIADGTQRFLFLVVRALGSADEG